VLNVTPVAQRKFQVSSNKFWLITHIFNTLGAGYEPNVDSYIWKDVKSGKVHGGNWSACTTHRKPLQDIPTDLGPGQYDVERWERSSITFPIKML
jgi:hypothetical protein